MLKKIHFHIQLPKLKVEIWKKILNFGRIIAIENLKMNSILIVSFLVSIFGQQEKDWFVCTRPIFIFLFFQVFDVAQMVIIRRKI
jgi:hypothetical protein